MDRVHSFVQRSRSSARWRAQGDSPCSTDTSEGADLLLLADPGPVCKGTEVELAAAADSR